MYHALISPIIWSGHEDCNKFVLSGFPNNAEELEAFEREICNIKAVIMATEGGNIVNVRNTASPSIFNIDSLF